MPSVLFVCTANMCRSPIAMALLENRVYRFFPLEDWRVESAGTWTQDGLSAISMARNVVANRGLNLNGHRSRQVTHQLVNSFDLILAMENWHKMNLLTNYPEIAGRVFLLSEMAGDPKDIKDPTGGLEEDYLASLNEIDGYIEHGFQRILALARGQVEKTNSD